jgi:hypothetical protein
MAWYLIKLRETYLYFYSASCTSCQASRIPSQSSLHEATEGDPAAKMDMILPLGVLLAQRRVG